MTERFANKALTTLNGGVNSGAISVVVADASAFPSSGNFRLVVESEIMLVTTVVGNTFVVTRGVEGTAAVAHSSGVVAAQVVTAGMLNALAGNFNQYGLEADIPAAGTPGVIYHTSDTNREARDNGTTWDWFASGGGGVVGTDKQVAFNDAGTESGNAALTFDKTSGITTLAQFRVGAVMGVVSGFTLPAVPTLATASAVRYATAGGNNSTTGTAAVGGSLLMFDFGAGGNNTGSGNAGQGGINIWKTGAGGNASGAGAAGSGGFARWLMGVGGNNTGTGRSGDGGEFDVTSGNGGTAINGNAGRAGLLNLSTGSGGSTTGSGISGAGGTLNLSTGDAGNCTGTGNAGSGGDINLYLGAGGNVAATGKTPGTGGSFSLMTGIGGGVGLYGGTGGNGTNNGNGGAVGIGGGPGRYGGDVQISPGPGGLSGASGSVWLYDSTFTPVVQVTDGSLGFFAATPVTQPTVTGDRFGSTGLAGLLTQLASTGLIVDGTTNAIAPVLAATANAFAIGQTITASAITNVPLTLNAASGQTADIQQWKDSGGNVLSSITAAGGYYAKQNCFFDYGRGFSWGGDGAFNGACQFVGDATNVVHFSGNGIYIEHNGSAPVLDLRPFGNGTGTTCMQAILIHPQTASTPATGFGSQIQFQAQSTTTNARAQGALQATWATATDATRKGRLALWASDSNGDREGVRVEGDGTQALVGFFGGSAATQQTVTGSRGGNAAVASLLTALANLGLIVDSST